MAAHPKKIIYCIHKVPEDVQKYQLPNPFPSEYLDPIASALKYRRALASRLGTPYTHTWPELTRIESYKLR